MMNFSCFVLIFAAVSHFSGFNFKETKLKGSANKINNVPNRNGFIDGVVNNVYHDIQKRVNGLDSSINSRVLNSPFQDLACNFKVNDASIIKTTESTENGADFLSFIPALDTRDECQMQCCITPQCNLAVFKESVQVILTLKLNIIGTYL